ncbi:MAG: hypothetical protein PHE56_13265, partial [Bacteroidales bacterium]|nr:hypothetical protein [Bacteroidales bacterium]
MKKLLFVSLIGLLYTGAVFSQCSNPNCGSDFAICGNSALLEVQNATIGYWSALYNGNPFPDEFTPNPTLTEIVVTIASFTEPTKTFEFIWHDDSGPCSDTVAVTFARMPIASVGITQLAEVCGTEFTFSADTTGYSWASFGWSSSNLSAVFSDGSLPDSEVSISTEAFGDSAHVSNDFVWTASNLSCLSKDTIHVTFYQRPVAFAGDDDAVCGNEYNLHAELSIPESSNYTPLMQWGIAGHPSGESADISSINTVQPHLTVSGAGLWELTFTERNSLLTSCYTRDTATIEFVEIPVVNAGPDKDVCGNCTQLEATSSGDGGSWIPNGCSFEIWENLNTQTCSPTYGDRHYTWLANNTATTLTFTCVATDTVVITFWREPTAELFTPSIDTTYICELSYTNLEGSVPESGITGYWYCPNPSADYGNAFDEQTSVTVPNTGYYDFYWIEANGPVLYPGFCNDTAGPVTIAFASLDANTISDISDTIISCGMMYYDLVAANPGIANGYWVSESAFLPIGGTDLNSPAIDIMVDMPTVAEFYWILQHGPTELNCADTAGPAIIRFLSEPTAEILTDMSDTIFNCGDTYYNLLAESPESQFVGYWNTPYISSIMFGDWNNEETSVMTCSYGLRSFYWIVQYSDYPSCKDTAGPVYIHFLREMSSFAGDDNSIFGSDYLLTGEIGEFYNTELPRTIMWENADAIFSNPQNDTTLVTVFDYDEYEFVLSAYYTDHPECGDSDTVSILFMNPNVPSADLIIANVNFDFGIEHPFNEDVTVLLYQELGNKSEIGTYELKSQKNLGSNGQVVFEDIGPGVYFISSYFTNTDGFNQILENVYSGDFLIVDDAESIVKNEGLSEFVNLTYQTRPDFTGSNLGYGKVGYIDGDILNGVPNQVIVLYNSDSDEVLDVSITNSFG